MMTRMLTTILFAILLVACFLQQQAEAARGRKFGFGLSRNADIRRLQEELSIGDDPNEDIRTNILLNMEGI